MSPSAVTTSTIISFLERYELDAATFYAQLAETDSPSQTFFRALAREDERFQRLVTRTYRETISDALESGFAFTGLALDRYPVPPAPTTGYHAAVRAAIRLETTAAELYQSLAAQATSLLATIPHTFARIARARRERKARLEALLTEG
jgi:rubrerythrin